MIVGAHFCLIYCSGSDLTHWGVFQVDDSVIAGRTSWHSEIRTAGNFHMQIPYLTNVADNYSLLFFISISTHTWKCVRLTPIKKQYIRVVQKLYHLLRLVPTSNGMAFLVVFDRECNLFIFISYTPVLYSLTVSPPETNTKKLFWHFFWNKNIIQEIIEPPQTKKLKAKLGQSFVFVYVYFADF